MLPLLLPIVFSASADAAGLSHIARPRPSASKILHARLHKIAAKFHITAAGVAVIKGGRVVWTDYQGEQAPGVRASAATEFTVASITKTVTAETILRLIAQGKVSLDEPMAPYWLDPDLKDDPRAQKLTVRMALDHTTGLPNWRCLSPDGTYIGEQKLRFVHDPGTTFGYSGEGYDWLRRFAENKLGLSWEEIVRRELFAPLGLTHAAVAVHQRNFRFIARRLDANGTYYGMYCLPKKPGYCRPEGNAEAAYDMVISVPGYARFMIAAMNGRGLNDQLKREWDRVEGDAAAEPIVDCSKLRIRCPLRQGYGFGWQVLDHGSDKIVGHDGYSWSEITEAYFYTRSHDGLVVFLDAVPERGQPAMAEIIEALDPGSPLGAEFGRRARKQ